MLHRSLTFVFFLFFSSVVFAQTPAQFSENPQEFIQQLDEFMNKNKQDKMKIGFENFKAQYESGRINIDQQKDVVTVCNAMMEKKMNTNFFLKYLSVIQHLIGSGKVNKELREFNDLSQKFIQDIKTKSAKKYNNFLEFSSNFYEHKALRKTTGAMWRVETDQYQTDYKNGEFSLTFPKLDLYGIRKKDSISIVNTSGIYYPLDDLWKGKKGQVSWERLNMPNVVAKLTDYEFQLKKNAYSCENATLIFPKYFQNQEIKGRLEDRIVVQSKSSRATYPRFESQKKVLNIDNIGTDIKYTGGFKLSGVTVSGYGDKKNPANIRLLDGKTQKTKFSARALQFTIKEDQRRIVSEGTEVSLYFGQDSIYHPSTNLRVEIDDKYLTLSRGDRGSDRNPFFDSYHNIRLDADKLDWDLNGDTIVIGKSRMGVGEANDKIAFFESFHYFNEGEYRRAQSISSTNPIAVIMAYSKQQDSDQLDAEGLAKKFNTKFDVSSINSLLYTLVSQGFIEYDKDDKIVYIQEKLKHYAKAAVKKTDYDNIKIRSKTLRTNAYLYLDEKNENPFDIQDVGFVELSEKQKVAFKPMGKKILMKKNRNIDFNGKVFAGLTSIQGKDFLFDYDGFQIKMDSIRYFDLFENSGERDKNDEPIAYGIASRIEGLSGALLIDAPHNKSSKEEIEMFPSFSSEGHSYVYYDQPEIFDGVYKRDSFYFQLDEFGFDNLDNYQPEDILFEGEMYSSDIFPPFKENIVLNSEDKSLGFVHTTPTEGYSSYIRKNRTEGQGFFAGKILLSNNGFEGKGVINYLAASIYSSDIVFKPNRADCSAKNFDLEENRGSIPELPQVEGTDVKIKWLPYKDSLYITPDEIPFKMFLEDNHILDGTLVFTPGGLRGDGLLDWDKGAVYSKDFLFGAFSAKADTSNMKIKAVGETDELAFDSKNVATNIDFDKGIGHFKSNVDEISTNMPYNKYKTSMDEFTWDMNKEKVKFKSKEGILDEFLSPELDSLRFQGATAEYDLANSTLIIGGVPFIKSADALIYPETGEVQIAAGGKMAELENARILASDKTKYHAINRATINIQGGRDYTATGFYEYNIGHKKQEIELTNIVGAPVGKGKRTEKTLATRGSGSVTEEDDFHIDYKTKFKGEISLSSEEKDLYFEGYAKLDLDFTQKNWFHVRSKADKKNLAIAYNKTKSESGEPLRTGLFIDRSTGNPYPSIMGILLARKDRALMDVTGVFKYNNSEDKFIFGDSTKLTVGAYKGDVFEVNAKTKKCKATGTFNIGEEVLYFQPTVAGIAELDITQMKQDSTGTRSSNKQKLTMDAMATITYALPSKALDIMQKDLKSSMYDVRNIELPRSYAQMLPEIAGAFVSNERGYKQVVNNYKSMLKVVLPKKKKSPLFFFSYLPLKWNANLNSLVSSKKTLGLSQVNGESINKMVEAYVEFRMPSSGEDGMHLYVKNPSTSGGHYYYFKYKEGVLETCSSNSAYNAAIKGAKKKERIIKMGKGKVYTIEPISEVSAELFKNRVKSAW